MYQYICCGLYMKICWVYRCIGVVRQRNGFLSTTCTHTAVERVEKSPEIIGGKSVCSEVDFCALLRRKVGYVCFFETATPTRKWFIQKKMYIDEKGCGNLDRLVEKQWKIQRGFSIWCQIFDHGGGRNPQQQWRYGWRQFRIVVASVPATSFNRRWVWSIFKHRKTSSSIDIFIKVRIAVALDR